MAVEARSLDMRLEKGTANACKKCKWGIEDPTDPTKGQCVSGRTDQGGIWKRMIRDYFNMTCDKFEEGELSFRDHV
jgi:benzylsuccinate synthase